MFRQPIITIMGHIDSGKTTFLDSIKGTAITKMEAGKITQHIGATEITLKTIEEISSHLFNKFKFKIDIPGLLFIDTPGHNAFDNLRERGGALADLVVLVVDINKGLQAQDNETLEILKMYKVPFIVVANKVDLIRGWHSEGKDISDALDKQSTSVNERLDEQLYKIVGQLYDKGFTSERFDRVTDFKKQIAIIPASAEKNYGLTESILFLAALSQKFLDKRLTIDENQKPQATILELGELKGIGPTADAILYQGVLRVKDSISFLSREGVIETKVKSLLKPNVMSAINKKRDFKNVDYVSAASGVKIVAPNLNKCIPGSAIVSSEDIEAVKNLKQKPLSCMVNEGIAGGLVKSDTLGSLEALTKLMDKANICIAKSDIGDITRKDILELKIINERDSKKGVLFLFNATIPKEFEDELEKENIPIFKNNIIYKLIEDYEDWLNKTLKKEKETALKEIIFPCTFKVLKNHVFRTSKPAVVGVKVLKGKLVPGAKLLLDGKESGAVEGIQSEGKYLNELEKEKEAAVSIKGLTFLKDFKEEDVFEVDIPQDSIKKLEEINYELTDEEIKLINNAKARRLKTNA